MEINLILKNEFNRKEIKLLNLLEDDSIFENIVKIIRKKIGLPEEGIDSIVLNKNKVKIVEVNKKLLKIINPISPKIVQDINILIDIYQLPYSWLNTLYSLITINVALPPMRYIKGYEPIEIKYNDSTGIFFSNKKYIYGEVPDIRQKLEIIVREGMSYGEFIKELKKQKETINKYLKHLHRIPKINITNIKIKKEILKLAKTLKDSEISDQLNKKYGEKLSFDPNYENISKYKNRYLKAIKNLPKNARSLDYLDKLF